MGLNVGTGDRINEGAGMDVEPGVGTGDSPEFAEAPGAETGNGPELDKEMEDGAGLRGRPSDCMSA